MSENKPNYSSDTLKNKIEALPSISNIVKQNNVAAKKSLGQNFIFDTNVLNKIVSVSGNVFKKHVLEIGPGPGGLTRAILSHGAGKVTSVEKDERCINLLKDLEVISEGKLEIINGDALKIEEREIASSHKIKVIANLPYNIATELLFKWLSKLELFESMTLMFQKEVSDRITAKSGNKIYGRVSVIAQWLCEVRHEFDIPPEVFFPAPKVTSSVITLIPRKQPLYPANKEYLEKLCKAAFGQRRKMLRSSLRQILKEPELALNAALIDPTMRAEQLTIEQFCALARAIELWQLQKL